jgi:putative two-component system response regulator
MSMSTPLPKLLVVEDDGMVASLVRDSLAGQMEVTVCATGAAALASIRAGNGEYRLALVDMNLPDIPGVQVAEAIVAMTGVTRVLLTSGNPSADDLSRALNTGVDGFLAKPFVPEALCQRLWTLMDVEKGQARFVSQISELQNRAQEDEEELQLLRRASLLALAKLAESRDPETGAHVERVGAFCAVIAEFLAHDGPYQDEISPQYIENIRLAAPLHDIGKVGIPDAILRKPARLTPEEFETMKAHTTIGARVLDTALQTLSRPDPMLIMARDIVLCHHERWDGRGYPQGLAGLEIPLSARIVTVVDSYDALRSRRPYKPAFTRQETTRIMREQAGGQYDPEIMRALKAVETRLEQVAEDIGTAEEDWDTVVMPEHRAKP